MGTRADDIRARLTAEIELAEAEDRLIAAKAKKSTPADELRAIKDEVRALRQASRAERDAAAAASPEPIKATAAVKKGN